MDTVEWEFELFAQQLAEGCTDASANKESLGYNEIKLWVGIIEKA